MTRAASEHQRLRITDVLVSHPGLRLRPTQSEALLLEGELYFHILGPTGRAISDAYNVAIHIPYSFPKVLATVFEVGSRIEKGFHKLVDGSLCLGSPLRIRLALASDPTAFGLIERVILPYLYGHSHFRATGTMPFGELAHGSLGLKRDFAGLFGASASSAAAFAAVSALRRRVANKKPCPCGSGKRLGRCHHRIVNALRCELGRPCLRQMSASFRNQ